MKKCLTRIVNPDFKGYCDVCNNPSKWIVTDDKVIMGVYCQEHAFSSDHGERSVMS